MERRDPSYPTDKEWPDILRELANRVEAGELTGKDMVYYCKIYDEVFDFQTIDGSFNAPKKEEETKTCPTCGAAWTFVPYDGQSHGTVIVDPQPTLCVTCQNRLARIRKGRAQSPGLFDELEIWKESFSTIPPSAGYLRSDK